MGNFGTGSLSITGGGTVSNFNGNIGAYSGSSGTATVDGPGSVWTNNSVLAVGSLGEGALNITGGGVVSSTNGRIGREAGSTGTVLIDGPGSRWNASGEFTMGLFDTGTATLTVQNGGVLSAAGGMTIGPLGTVRGDGTIVGNVDNIGGVIAPSVRARRPARCTSPAITRSHVGGEVANRTGLADEFRQARRHRQHDAALRRVSLAAARWKCRWRAATCRTAASRSTFSTGAAASAATFESIQLPTLGGTLVWDTSQLYTTGVLSVIGPAAFWRPTSTRTASSTAPT